jgi:hypothetical protein
MTKTKKTKTKAKREHAGAKPPKVPPARGRVARTPSRTSRVRAAARYDAPKEFDGKRYTGMQVGRGHTWKYDAGDWRERKVTPDEWVFRYAVTKRRAGKAPEGSGAPVGTEYHWFVLADQLVRKLDANSYSTEMTGLKLKLAHKRSDAPRWSASDAAQRRHLIAVLQRMIAQLEGDELVAEGAHGGADPGRGGGGPLRRGGDAVAFAARGAVVSALRGRAHEEA